MPPETVPERNGSLRSYAEQFTELEPFGSSGGTNDWYQAKCPLPGCEDRAQSFYIFPDGNQELFECHECETSGGLEEFAALMNSNDQRRVSQVSLSLNGGVTPVTALRFSEMEPPGPREHVVEGLVPKGHTTSLFGDGGSAKSVLALSAGTAISGGRRNGLGVRCRTARFSLWTWSWTRRSSAAEPFR
jgi:hypothetical protein